jgi:hypothetical protein
MEKFALNNGNFFKRANKNMAKHAMQRFYGGLSAYAQVQAYLGYTSISPWNAPGLREDDNWYFFENIENIVNGTLISYYTYFAPYQYLHDDVDYSDDSYTDMISDGGEDQYDEGNGIFIRDSYGWTSALPYTQDYTQLWWASPATAYSTWKLASGKAFFAAFYAPACDFISVWIDGELGFDGDGYHNFYDFTDSSGDFAIFTRMTCCDDGTLTHMMFVPITGQRFSDDWWHFTAVNSDDPGYYTYNDYTDYDTDWIRDDGTYYYGYEQPNAPPTTSAMKPHVGACTVYYLLFMGKEDYYPYDGDNDSYQPAFSKSNLEAIADAFVDYFHFAWWK